MIVVITGSNGFTAYFLSKYIKNINPEIVICGIDIATESNNCTIDKYFSTNELSLLIGFLNFSSKNVKVFHLAGILKSESMEILMEANVIGTAKYIELFRKLKKPQIFVNIGSSSEYGIQKNSLLSENLIPNPISLYGLTKYLQSELVLRSSKIYDFKAISTRTFNLIGPGLSENFIVGKVVSEFLKIKNGEKEACDIGRMDSVRNFIDVRDAVKIYWELSEHGVSSEIFNVGNPESHSIAVIISILSQIMEINPIINNNSQLISKFDIDYQYPDLEKTSHILNNYKYLNIKNSLTDVVNSSLNLNNIK